MQDTNIEQELLDAHTRLRQAEEAAKDPKDACLIEPLEALGSLLRKNNKLLEAANVEARIQVIKSKQDGSQAQSAVETEKKCPYCAETIKAEAMKCRYCGSELPKPPSGCSQGGSSKALPPVTKGAKITDIRLTRRGLLMIVSTLLLIMIISAAGDFIAKTKQARLDAELKAKQAKLDAELKAKFDALAVGSEHTVIRNPTPNEDAPNACLLFNNALPLMRFRNLIVAGDKYEQAQAQIDGQAVYLDSGDRVVVLEKRPDGCIKVRVVSGKWQESADEGLLDEYGWMDINGLSD